jgi:hypothetical protein
MVADNRREFDKIVKEQERATKEMLISERFKSSANEKIILQKQFLQKRKRRMGI